MGTPALAVGDVSSTPAPQAPLTALMEAHPGAEAWHSVKVSFGLMAIAEEAIEEAIARHPAHRGPLHDGFRYLCWVGEGVPPEKVYRHHIEEILERLAAGEDMDPATDAEVLMALHLTSLKAPLSQQGDALYCRLYESVVQPLSRLGYVCTPEPWPGAAGELDMVYRRRLRRDRDVTKQVPSH